MPHIGVVSLPLPSHLNLFLTLGKTLFSRGHRVTFFGIPEIRERVIAHGLEFARLEPESAPPGTLGSLISGMGDTQGVAAKAQRQFDRLRLAGILSEGPAVISGIKPDLLVIDQAEPGGGSVAEKLGLPWVTVSSGLCLNSEPRVPPFFTTWSYAESGAAIARNRLAHAITRLVTRPSQKMVNGYRKQWNLNPVRGFEDTFSPYAQICQQIAEFDYPRAHLPSHFHYVGPIRRPAASPAEFPWERLDSRPLIYASLGTLVNQHGYVYRIIAEACLTMQAQLVISLGGGAEVEAFSGLAGAPLIVKWAPQRELLSRAALTITHAGLNTALESLCEGVPLVAIPIAFEQPGVAARIRWTGVGDFINLSGLNAMKLRTVIQRVLSDSRYTTAARRMQKALHPVQGSERAAEIIEAVIETGRPILDR